MAVRAQRCMTCRGHTKVIKVPTTSQGMAILMTA